MANKLTMGLSQAGKVRDSVSKKQAKEIRALYNNVAKDLQKQMEYLKTIENTSSALQQIRIGQLQKQLTQMIEFTGRDTEQLIKHGILEVSQGVCLGGLQLAQDLGFGVQKAYANVPNDVVRKLVTGKIYQEGWSLSESIWDMTKTTQKDIYKVVAAGIAQNKSAYAVAKDLEEYVNPLKKKPWNLKMEDGKRIYKRQVDYNAQRLARTLTQHSYQQSLIEITKDNPWLHNYIWHSNGSRTCPLCASRDGQRYNVKDLPMDHPNGMCVIEPDFDDDEKITSDLAKWVTADYGEYPEIDKYAVNLFGVDSVKQLQGIQSSNNSIPVFNELQEKYLGKYGFSPSNMPKTFDEFSHKISQQDIGEILSEMGTSWADPHPYQQLQKYYEENLIGKKNNLVTSSKKAEKAAKKTTKKTSTKKTTSILDDINEKFNEKLSQDYSKWIEMCKGNTTKAMLEAEEAQFAKFTEEGVKGVEIYSGSSYREMNSYARLIGRGLSESEAIAESGISEYQLKAFKEAKNALNSVGLDKDYVLRRGTDLGDLAGLIGGDFNKIKRELENEFWNACGSKELMGKFVEDLDNKYSGLVGKMHGFTSTSSIYEKGFSGEVEMIFYAPKGTPASSIMKISRYGTAEGETLLNAGTTVRVAKIEEGDRHMGCKVRIFCEIILP